MDSDKTGVICRICFEVLPSENFLGLSCSHRFCSSCLVAMWRDSIENGRVTVSDLKCPEAECGAAVTYDELKGNLPTEVFQKYENFCFENYTTENSNEIGFTCPNKDCLKRSTIWKEASFVTCSFCKIKFCTNCRLKFHEGIDCEEAIENDGVSEEDKTFKLLKQKECWTECPECKIVGKWEEGCLFIKCESPVCNKKTSFCYLCGDRLEQKDHYDHFENKDVYEAKECLTTKSRKLNPDSDTKRKKTKEKPAKQGTACPKCNSFSPKLEISDHIYFCENNECDLKTFCLDCKKKIEDADFDYHNEKQCSKSFIKRIFGFLN